MPSPMVPARFIEPMLLLRTERLPEGAGLVYELKLDGYRALAFKTGGKVHLRSRNDKDFSGKYPAIAKALAPMPDDTVVDGEIVAMEAGRPSFNALQNHGSTDSLFYYVFDVMVVAGKDVMMQPLEARRELLRDRVLAQLADPIRESPGVGGGPPRPDSLCQGPGLGGLGGQAPEQPV
jgi:bifunctional non-homologous end joining protein LigD